MVRTVHSGEACLVYLNQNAQQENFVIGLIIGQVTASRETVIHLARTPEEKTSETVPSEGIKSIEKLPEGPSSLLGVSELWVADHAKHVTRMLPGGMFVQGIFITSPEDVFSDQNAFNKIKNILNCIYKTLDSNSYTYGNPPNSEERLVLHMSTVTRELMCKSVSLSPTTNRTEDVEWKFVAKRSHWQRLDCIFEFDEIYPIVVKNNGVSVKQQFNQILERTAKQIEKSVMFIDGELRQGDESLDALGKKSRSKSTKSAVPEPPKPMNVSLFIPYENSLANSVEYLECEGSIHFSGVVASCVFLYPRATVDEAVAAVKQDIVRSLASRFTMHCDALIDDNLLPEEKVCFNEPPRRVLVPLSPGAAPGGLFLCDYLFPGEAPAEALVSVRELLDVELREGDVVTDLETPADASEFDALDRDASSDEMMATPQEASQFMYMAGIGFALLVLVVSILIHYYQSIVKFFS